VRFKIWGNKKAPKNRGLWIFNLAKVNNSLLKQVTQTFESSNFLESMKMGFGFNFWCKNKTQNYLD
jgi:hypothetical protein